ncbi:MAG: transglutaminase domain-containing protein [candidate division NC10 bacterium]|nr:transglutaminase domain-containing protein [candidate division NC10 bacterium]
MKRVLLTVVAVMLVASAGIAAYRSGWLAKYLPFSAAVSEAQIVEISTRGPGMRRQPMDALQLPVPRTFEMTHVDPTHFAVALGKDPARIFEFVRDQIAYEVYTGCLRGPRGTLMAMAGNSVDRAALLASMLQHAGHRVRYVRGSLPEREAKELVTSMWAERPQVAEPKVGGEPAPALKAALDTLAAGVKRDYTLIRDHLKRANLTIPRESPPSLDSLVKEAQVHYWVQWWKDGAWVDLDPSFGDAAPGRTFARSEQPLDVLPEALFHRVNIRIRLEEYAIMVTGDAQVKPASRDILTYTAKAADLSGIDLVLSHQPENWKGPVTGLQEAIASAITSTGRVKPVLLVGDQPITGEAFRQKPPTGAGIGSITDLLGGAGTRKPVPVATSEWLEFEFIAPDGRKEAVVREIFDLVGKARRAAGRGLSADEVRKRTGEGTVFDVTEGMYSLFFATGRIDMAHLSKVVGDPAQPTGDAVELRQGLRRLSMTFTIVSNGLLTRVGRAKRAVTIFYPDSPQLLIAEVSAPSGVPRISLDLRRAHVRGVTSGSNPEDLFFARAFRGILDGTLERVLMEYVTSAARNKGELNPVMSTSSVFELAKVERVSLLLLPQENSRLDSKIPQDAMARLAEDSSRGYLAIAPQRTFSIAGVPRFAWWRIEPRSGEVTAVTDEGLHQTATENVYVVRERETGTIRIYRSVRGRYVPYGRTFQSMQQDSLYEFLWAFHPDANWIFGIAVL